VRGLPGTIGVPKVPYHITIVNHLPTATLQKAIAGAQFVISRCGYSTVMDLVTLQKKCIFIPTPMQTEQEYLARHLMQQNFALAIPQQKFVLKNAVELATTFPYRFPEVEKTDALQQAVTDLLQQCVLKKQAAAQAL
jgi:UDP-N-acetylglucosamine:LPS N-acetylglucosamine transferase